MLKESLEDEKTGYLTLSSCALGFDPHILRDFKYIFTRNDFSGNVEVKVVDKNEVVMKFYKNVRCYMVSLRDELLGQK